MLNPVHLRTLQEVVRSKSLAAAASRLGYTASAVSQQMVLLEQATGTVLFERTARSIRPTAAAHRLALRAALVLSELDRLQHGLDSESTGRRRQLCIGIFPSAALHLLPRALRDPAWIATETTLTIDVADSTDVLRALAVSRTIDVAFVYRFEFSTLQWPPSLEVRRSWTDPMVVLLPADCDQAATAEPDLTMRDLADLPWITHVEGTAGALAIERIWTQCGVTARVVARSDDFAVTEALVNSGLGAAVVPSMVTTHLPAGVAVRRPADLTAGREMVVLTREGGDDAVIDLLADLILPGGDTGARTLGP